MFNFELLLSAIIFVTIDYIYLNLMKGYFGNQVKRIQGSPMKINLLARSYVKYKLNII